MTMSSLALLLLVVFSLSLHACTTDPLCLTQMKTAKHHFDKGLDEVKMLETSTASRLRSPSTIAENQAQQRKVAKDETKNNNQKCGRTSTLKEEEIVGATSETKIVTSSFQTDLPFSLTTEEQRRHARSMPGPSRHHVEEPVNPNPSETMDDTVEMDYAQPHLKPPIHNEKP